MIGNICCILVGILIGLLIIGWLLAKMLLLPKDNFDNVMNQWYDKTHNKLKDAYDTSAKAHNRETVDEIFSNQETENSEDNE